MKKPRYYANGWRAKESRAEVVARNEPCWICEAFGRPAAIDYSLPAGDPMSFEVDHLVPVSKGGSLYDPANLAAAHRRCNQWRGNKSVERVLEIARGQRPAPIQTTTDW